MNDAFSSSREGWGKTLILGVEMHGSPISLNSIEILKGRSVYGTFFGGLKPKSDISILVKKYLNKELNLDGFITHEVDAPTTKRGKGGGWVVERLLNQLLVELDGADKRKGVFVIGATNRPDVMDRAVLRPGRFGKLLYVPLPIPDECWLILKALARKKPIDESVDLCSIAQMRGCEDLSGADLAAMMNEAAMACLGRETDIKQELIGWDSINNQVNSF